VLLITGSGAQDRDETIFDHKPFLVLSDYLTRRGFAVLRVDDRGVGGSKGAGPDDTTNDYASDVRAGVEWLKARPEVDPKRIGLIGHSEGGLIAPLAAKDNPSVAFAILWAGSGVNGRDVIIEQVRAVSAASGAAPEVATANADRQRAVADAIIAAPDQAAAYDAAMKAAAAAGEDAKTVGPGIKFMSGAWARNFLAYDPAPTLRALDIPVLALVGGKDVQVVASQNVPALQAALAGNPRARVMELPGLNHLFQKTGTGAVSEYGTITQTIDPGALKIMGDWLVEVTR
jgi:pimeloyl-ACP methyl ester carboxylesterase